MALILCLKVLQMEAPSENRCPLLSLSSVHALSSGLGSFKKVPQRTFLDFPYTVLMWAWIPLGVHLSTQTTQSVPLHTCVTLFNGPVFFFPLLWVIQIGKSFSCSDCPQWWLCFTWDNMYRIFGVVPGNYYYSLFKQIFQNVFSGSWLMIFNLSFWFQGQVAVTLQLFRVAQILLAISLCSSGSHFLCTQ